MWKQKMKKTRGRGVESFETDQKEACSTERGQSWPKASQHVWAEHCRMKACCLSVDCKQSHCPEDCTEMLHLKNPLTLVQRARHKGAVRGSFFSAVCGGREMCTVTPTMVNES